MGKPCWGWTSNQYQVLSAERLVRFWTLVWAAYSYLDEERAICTSGGSDM